MVILMQNSSKIHYFLPQRSKSLEPPVSLIKCPLMNKRNYI